MVRVAELKRQIRAGDHTAGAGRADARRRRWRRSPSAPTSCRTSSTAASSIELQPLAGRGGHPPRPAEGRHGEQERFLERIFPPDPAAGVTPLAIDPRPPVPAPGQPVALPRRVDPAVDAVAAAPHALAVVHIPSQVVPRFVPLPGPAGQHAFMLLEDMMRLHLPRAVPRLRDPLVPRDPRHPRRRSRARRGRGRGSADQRSRRACASGGWAPRCGCSTTPSCRPTCSRRWSTSSS